MLASGGAAEPSDAESLALEVALQDEAEETARIAEALPGEPPE